MKQKESEYRGCELSWVEPPLLTSDWNVTVASNDPRLAALIGPSANVFNDPRSHEGAINKAKQFVDSLL